MGNSQASPFYASLEGFDIIERKLEQNVTTLKKKSNAGEYLMKEATYNDEKLFSEAIKQHKNRKSYKCEHLTLLEKYEKIEKDNFCSTLYKIYSLWVHPSRSLHEEILQRIVQKRNFSEKQLWSITASCILALSELQRHDIFHEHLSTSSIFLTEDGLVQIADPLAIQNYSNFHLIKDKRTNLNNIYISPEQCSAIESHAFCFRHFKNDVWCLGMIILECALLNTENDWYKNQFEKVNWLSVEKSLVQLESRYGGELKSVVKLMLMKNKRDRPDWEELESFVRRDQSKMLSPAKHSILNTSNIAVIKTETKKEEKHPTPEKPLSHFNGVTNNMQTQSQVVFTQDPQHNYHKTVDFPFSTDKYQHHSSIPSLLYGGTSYRSEYPPLKPAFQLERSSSDNKNPVLLHSFSQNAEKKQPFKSAQDFKTYLHAQPASNMKSSAGFHSIADNDQIQQREKRDQFRDRDALKTFVSPSSLHGYLFSQPPQQKNSEIKQQAPTSREDLKGILTANQEQQQNFSEKRKPVQELRTTPPIKPEKQHRLFIPEQISKIKNKPIESIDVQKNIQNQHDQNKESLEQKKIEESEQNWKAANPKITRNESEEQGEYVVEHFKQGSRYEGYKVNGKRHGHGKFFYQDGGLYEGQWVMNKMEGHGALYYQSGKIAYEGQWKNDQFHGKGKLYNDTPELLTTPFDYSNFDSVEDFWTNYEGQFYEDMKQGRGKFTLSNGEYYLGEFCADCINGSGKYHNNNGIIRGIWKDNHLQPLSDPTL